MAAGGYMQEEYSCCWLLLSPMRFLLPRSPRQHSTGLRTASPVGWKHPMQPQGERASWCPCPCGWMRNHFLPPTTEAGLLLCILLLFSLLCCAFRYAIKCSHSFGVQLSWTMLPYCQPGAIKDCRTFLQEEDCAHLKQRFIFLKIWTIFLFSL